MISTGAEEKAKEIEVCLSFNYLCFAIPMIPYSLQLVGTPEVTLEEYILSKVQTVRVFSPLNSLVKEKRAASLETLGKN